MSTLSEWSANVLIGDGCWEWQGRLNNKGYGKLGRRYAHRMAHELFCGPIGNLQVLHHCDNRACVRPSHLFLGTQSDNIRDMYAKGRRPLHLVKLTDEQAAEIRTLGGTVTQQRLAKQFGVSPSYVSMILAGARR